MSTHFKCFIALFVLWGVLDRITIDCTFVEDFNDCFGMCLRRFAKSPIQRRACTKECKRPSRERNNLDNNSFQGDRPSNRTTEVYSKPTMAKEFSTELARSTSTQFGLETSKRPKDISPKHSRLFEIDSTSPSSTIFDQEPPQPTEIDQEDPGTTEIIPETQGLTDINPEPTDMASESSGLTEMLDLEPSQPTEIDQEDSGTTEIIPETQGLTDTNPEPTDMTSESLGLTEILDIEPSQPAEIDSISPSSTIFDQEPPQPTEIYPEDPGTTKIIPETQGLTETNPEPTDIASESSGLTEMLSEKSTIKYFAGYDYSDNNERFVAIPQPNHCGFKSTKDMIRKSLIGGSGLGRIVGGVDANPHEFPWVVSIQYYKDQNQTVHFCGGAIITTNYILTAAHCMDRFVGKERSVVVKVGVNNPNESSLQKLTVSKVIVHEGWDSNLQVNDISLIRVRPEIKFTKTASGVFKVNVVCLPNSATEPNGMAVLAGWGEETFKSGTPAEWLQKVTVPFVEKSKCARIYRDYLERVVPDSQVKVLSSHICAGGVGGEDACRGDSGGALMVSKSRQSFHVGIVSFSVPCAIENLPTIYTNVVSFMDWIYNQLE